MKRSSSVYDYERVQQTIVINGSAIPFKDFRKSVNAKRQQHKAKQDESYIKAMSTYITSLTKSVRITRSLVSYYNNGYRCWGNVAKEIIHTPSIHKWYRAYIKDADNINETLNTIQELAKHNDRNVFQYVEQLSYNISDATEHINNLTDSVLNSGVLSSTIRQHECISGTGKRLGLATLMRRTNTSLKQMDAIAKELNLIARKGLDIMNYLPNGRVPKA